MLLGERFRTGLADRYRIERELGAGGMATVYLAHDVRHDRDVALKVLLPELAAVIGAERFLNEIKVTANLQHPHILPLFDSGEVAGFLFYVMPYIPGESLRARLDRERQLPVGEAVRIAAEAASALDYAHRQGVLHRDIKPGNILLHEGQALVADFGIALALRRAGGDRITQTGLSLGTPEYMSPEQASGDRDLDARTDVYSLGAVLYEMLAGEPPHTGPTVQAIIARALAEPVRPVRQLRETAPVALSATVDRALAKLPADRFTTAAEFADALTRGGQSPVNGPTPSGPSDRRRGEPRSSGTRRPWRLYGTIAGGVVLAAAGIVIGRATVRSAHAPPVTAHFVIDLPDGTSVDPSDLPAVAISPQGTLLAFVGETASGRRLYLRDLDGLEIRPLPGTEGALGPFFSPDGRWLGFFAGGKLAKIPVAGGARTVLADAALARGASWGANDTILFTSAPGTGLWEVPAAGGPAQVLTQLDLSTGERTHRLPDIVDQDRAALFTVRRGSQATFDDAEIDVWRFGPHERSAILQGGSQARFVPTRDVAFVRANILYAVPVDPGTFETVGQPVAIQDSIMTDPSTGAAQFAFSRNGTFVYLAGGPWAA
jgi:serine/threonine protein kinase